MLWRLEEEGGFVSVWGVGLLVLPIGKATLDLPCSAPACPQPSSVLLRQVPLTVLPHFTRHWWPMPSRLTPTRRTTCLISLRPNPSHSSESIPHPCPPLMKSPWPSTFLMFAPHILISHPVFHSTNVTEAYASFYLPSTLQAPWDQSVPGSYYLVSREHIAQRWTHPSNYI